jgi:hypothetical protein
MTAPADVVFLFACDNTPLDNDSMEENLRDHLERDIGDLLTRETQ